MSKRADWRIVVRDVTEFRLGQLRGWTQATFIPRWSGIGTWAITVPYDAPGASMFVPGCGVVIYRNGEYVMSGPLRSYQESWDSTRKQPVLTLAGVSDEYLLSTHLAFPNPSSAITSQTVNATRSLSNLAETVAKQVVSENLVPTAAAVLDRVVANFTVAPNLSRGSSISVSLRFDNILTWLQTAMPAAGLGFQVSYSDADKYVFDIVVPRDLHQDIVFSRGDYAMSAYSYTAQAPETTTVFVGGAGTGTSRAFTLVQNTPPYPWGLRQERFLDRRDTGTNAELLQAGQDELFNSGTPQNAFSFQVKDTDAIQFGRDYVLGDKVGFKIRNTAFSDVVTAVQYDLTASTERITPIVGSWDENQLGINRVVAALARRIGQVERRQ